MGQNYLRVLSELEYTKLVAACDLRPHIRQWVTKRYPGVRVVASMDELINDEHIQAVVVATEAHSHFAIVSGALRAGKHILCEKPLTTQVEEARALARPGMVVEACEKPPAQRSSRLTTSCCPASGSASQNVAPWPGLLLIPTCP